MFTTQARILKWLAELYNATWDREMERDFAPGGRGYFLLEEVEAEIAAGRTRPIEEVLNEEKTPD